MVIIVGRGKVRAGQKEDSYEIKSVLLYAFERFLYFKSVIDILKSHLIAIGDFSTVYFCVCV